MTTNCWTECSPEGNTNFKLEINSEGIHVKNSGNAIVQLLAAV